MNLTAVLARISVPTNGQREFADGMLLVIGLLFYVGGAPYISWWLLPLPEAWSEWIGKLLMVVGARPCCFSDWCRVQLILPMSSGIHRPS